MTDRPYFAYAKRNRNDPADPTRFTRPQPQYVRPAAAPRYTGPVAVLTGGSTVSAGETFTQALMERPGRTVGIGEHTQGVFSDTHDARAAERLGVHAPERGVPDPYGSDLRRLPGIPPHLHEPVFTEEEFEHGPDSAFDRAVAVLGGHAPH